VRVNSTTSPSSVRLQVDHSLRLSSSRTRQIRPAGVLFFSIAWGAATLFASQGRGRPEEVLLLALPHTATLIALCLAGQRSSAPAALAQPYPRDE